MNPSQVHSHISPRNVAPLTMEAADCRDYRALSRLGINIPDRDIRGMMASMDSSDLQGTITAPSLTTPVQFLQAWLPGFVRTITAARKIDELIGVDTVGSWEDEEIVQGIVEPSGEATLYGDITNVPLASWNTNFERRSVVRFEQGFRVGRLEEARAARIRINTAAEKRISATLSLEILRNRIGFYGYNNGENRTYGFLNDPALPAYDTVPVGKSGHTEWKSKTFLEITADIRLALSDLQTRSQDNINPETTDITLAVPTSSYQFLTVTSDYGISVREWLNKTYPRVRVVSAPQLNEANGGASVAYVYAEKIDDGGSDGGKTFIQAVPAKFQSLGVEQQAKGYVEDFSNATAGVMNKRPYAVVRLTGI